MQISNVEIKLRISDPDETRRAIEAIADGPVRILNQKDTYFDAGEAAYLKLREEFSPGRGATSASLIAYRRARSAEPRPSDIRLAHLDNGPELAETLGHALGVLVVVEKSRELYFSGQTRIHLDRVEGLGEFLELEVVLEAGQRKEDGLEIADRLIERLNAGGAEPQTDSYRDLLLGATTPRD